MQMSVSSTATHIEVMHFVGTLEVCGFLDKLSFYLTTTRTLIKQSKMIGKRVTSELLQRTVIGMEYVRRQDFLQCISFLLVSA